MQNEEKRNFSTTYYQYGAVVQQSKTNEEKLEELKDRINMFKNVSTLDEAFELSKKILPVKNEINKFYVGNAVCTVVQRKDCFRICLDSEHEFISYDFV